VGRFDFTQEQRVSKRGGASLKRAGTYLEEIVWAKLQGNSDPPLGALKPTGRSRTPGVKRRQLPTVGVVTQNWSHENQAGRDL